MKEKFIAAALFALGLIALAAVTPAEAQSTCYTSRTYNGGWVTRCN